ncbi:MAG TPA: helix-turn-helix domain-containing protein [Candidatus Bathyarchaeia archaeon]|jgi:DNA-binding HxlR family transcriptional regulator|nr:helix-turn-helix domain-containing protein [Candidatus Bathyarchaeia archaeon]
MKPKTVLSDELRKLVESRMQSNLKGIEETLQQIFKTQELSLENLKETMKSLEESFDLLSQKWNVQILYILFLKENAGFGELKKILGVNSRTLSDNLKRLKQYGYVTREVKQEPPLRVRYSLTTRGRNTILLALPFLYYSSSSLT